MDALISYAASAHSHWDANGFAEALSLLLSPAESGFSDLQTELLNIDVSLYSLKCSTYSQRL